MKEVINPIADVKFSSQIQTKRLTLWRICCAYSPDEPCIQSDMHEAIHASIPELSQRFSWMHPRPPTQTDTFIAYHHMVKSARDNSSFHFAVYDGDQFVAFVSLEGRELNVPAYSMGYWCRSDCAGKGYVSEAVLSVVNFAISEGIQRIDLTPEADNKPSIAIAQKLVQQYGFEYVGLKKNAWRHLQTNRLCHAAWYSYSADD